MRVAKGWGVLALVALMGFAGETIDSEEMPCVFDADGYVLAWSLEGEERWGRRFGETADALATDERGNVFVTGIYAPGEELGTGPLPGDPSGPVTELYLELLRDEAGGR